MPSPYEENALREIDAWKHPDLALLQESNGSA